MFYRQHRRKLSAEETAANAAKREARKQAAMICQVCGRAILANTGEIAHHGYERPGMGWQTSSCRGARELPFEVSRDALGAEINAAKNQLAHVESCIAGTKAETFPVAWSYTDKTGERHRGKFPERFVHIKRDEFPAAHAEYVERRQYRTAPEPTFDRLKETQIRKFTGEASNLRIYIERQTARFNGWSQTHRREGDQWVKIPA